MTSSTTGTAALAAKFDRRLAWYRGDSVRYLGVEFTAPAFADDAPRERKPLNLALVIDASGSMQGRPIEAARDGALAVARRLHPADRISVVSFDDEVTTHIAGARVGERLGAIEAAIAAVQADGSTDLAAGWLAGARCAAEVATHETGLRSRVVVLSDGHANRGIADPAELAIHAEQLRVRGLASSAIGIGEGYSAVQLEAIAGSGGGRLHRANSAAELVEVLLGELEESERTAADNVTITLGCPAGVRTEIVSVFPAAKTPNGMSASLGAVAADANVLVVFRVHLPAGEEGEELVFGVTGAWSHPGESSRRELGPAVASLRLVRGTENDAQQRDDALSIEVARAWQAAVVRRAVQINREGRYGGARAFVQEQRAHLQRYVRGLQGGDALVAELDLLAGSIVREWDEGSRQEAQLSSYKTSRREREVRADAPASWVEAMPRPNRP
jgi:Ca-activated chloride channel family protein